MPSFQHILVPFDFGDVSERALARALDLARDLQAKVTIAHVMQTPPNYYAIYAEGLPWPVSELEEAAKKALDDALVVAKKRYPDLSSRLDAVLLIGAPRVQIVEAAAERKADLIVIGTHGRRGLMRAFLGSVAESVVRTSPIPVLTVSA